MGVLKWKHRKSKRVRSRSLACNTQRIEGCARVSGWEQKEFTSFNHSPEPAKTQHEAVSAQLEHFWCQDESRATSNSQNSPWPELGGNHHLPPLQYTLQLLTGATSKWFFVRGLPNGDPEIPTIGIPAILEANNLTCRPLIAMRSKAKLQPLSKALQRYFARCLHARKSTQFLNFSGWESNCQFDSRPYFCP